MPQTDDSLAITMYVNITPTCLGTSFTNTLWRIAFTNIVWLSFLYWFVITSIIKFEIESLIHSHTSICKCWSLGIDKRFHLIFCCACDYLSLLELKLIHVNNVGPGSIGVVKTAVGRINVKMSFYKYSNSHIVIRRPRDHLIFILWIPVLLKRYFYILLLPMFYQKSTSLLTYCP